MEIDAKLLVKRGKELSFLLRHDTSYKFDEHGYREVKDLVDNHNYTVDLLDKIVETNNKKRYEYNSDRTKLRARQGHSIEVDVDLVEHRPPKVLYHGTSTRFLDSIKRSGIVKGSRNHVHLSATIETAVNVGSRHGSPFVITVNAEQMYSDGCKFYLSNNGVWLTDYVDSKYINF